MINVVVCHVATFPALVDKRWTSPSARTPLIARRAYSRSLQRELLPTHECVCFVISNWTGRRLSSGSRCRVPELCQPAQTSSTCVVCRGIDQERLGERSLARRGGPLRTQWSIAAASDPDELARLANGAARPPGVGAAGGTQIGAAIGREFPCALLRTVSRVPKDELQAALAGLVASEFVFQRAYRPVRFIRSSMRSCRTQPTEACCAALASSYTRTGWRMSGLQQR
jgi:hypothetical protein